ncbi:MAG: helix-turn-helix domain-containing protein [Oscillospiraceae bacterium]|nr:helix-turn-helix domain-containing protein [Oscillospiraceae bacterium]
MKNRHRREIRLGKNLVLSILNKEPTAKDKLIDFYDCYIREMATDPVYGSDGDLTGYYIDNDLAQELREALSGSLPALREVLIKKHFTNRPVVVVLTDLAK